MKKIKQIILPVLLSVIVLSMVISPTYPNLISAYALEVPKVLDKKCDLSLPPDEPISPDCELLNLLIAEEAAREAADIVLQNNIDAEEAARIAADADLQTQIDDAIDKSNVAIDEAIVALGIASGVTAVAAAGCTALVSCAPAAPGFAALSAVLGTIAGILGAINL